MLIPRANSKQNLDMSRSSLTSGKRWHNSWLASNDQGSPFLQMLLDVLLCWYMCDNQQHDFFFLIFNLQSKLAWWNCPGFLSAVVRATVEAGMKLQRAFSTTSKSSSSQWLSHVLWGNHQVGSEEKYCFLSLSLASPALSPLLHPPVPFSSLPATQ